MDEITTLPSDDVPDLQRTVQRKLGRCILQLQQYERLLKAMVAHSVLSGPPERLEANELIHHFLQCFDLWDAAGCIAAEGFLDESYETIDGHYLTLRDWAKSMDEARSLMASFMQTPQCRDFVINGIGLNGTVHWAGSGITNCLREAETKLTQAGWTLLLDAIRWASKTYPEQTPKRYGCGSWRQVLHESQQFEVRKESQADSGHTLVWYRSRPRETSKEQE